VKVYGSSIESAGVVMMEEQPVRAGISGKTVYQDIIQVKFMFALYGITLNSGCFAQHQG
jgi:hypothetical protein